MSRRSAARVYQRAEKAFRARQYGEAAAIVQSFLSDRGHETAADPTSMALMHELLALVHREHGEQQQHLERLLVAEQVAEIDGVDPDVLGRIRFQIGGALIDLHGMSELSQEYMRRAAATLADSVRYAELRETALEMLSADDVHWSVRVDQLTAELGRAEAELDAITPKWRRGRTSEREQDLLWRTVSLRKRLAALRIAYGTDDEAEDAFIECGAIAMTFHADDPDEFFVTLDNVGFALDRHLDLTYFLEEVAARGLEIARRSGADHHLASAHHVAAINEVMAGRPSTALRHALAALTLTERALAASGSITFRAANRQTQLDPRRHLALRLCAETGRWAGIAELIERGRLQSIPRVDAQTIAAIERASITPPDRFLDLLRRSTVALDPLRGVSVTGSDLPSIDPYAPAIDGATSLDRAIEVVGGPDAWWWGLWIGLGWVVSTARSPSGDWSGSYSEVDERTIAALASFDRLYREAGSLSPDERRASALFDQQLEHELMTDISSALVPPRLVEALRTAHQPLSLVVAGNLLGDLPLAALTVPGSTDRLVERALIRVQPPALITRLVDERPLTFSERCAFEIAIVDPTGDLRFSRHLDTGAESTLTHAENVRTADERTRPATIHEVQRALRTGEVRDGLLLYAGHIDEIPGTGVLSLRLMDGELPGLVLFADPTSWRVPSKVVLSGCSSAGSGGAGSGEWVGLAAGFLVAGARQVIATAWPLPESEMTAAFESELARRIVEGADPAVALRERQLDALARWRSGRVAEGLPLVWASYQFVGVGW